MKLTQKVGLAVAGATLLVVGAGSRGTGYASYAKAHPRLGRVLGVAEPREQLALMKRLFPSRTPERPGWDLVILVRSQIVKPLQTAALAPGR